MSDVKTIIQHSVLVVLGEKNNKFLFNSKEDKDEFLLSENKFCINQLQNYIGAFDKLERKTFKFELEKKRMAHAVHCGFHEVANTGTWNRSANYDALIA